MIALMTIVRREVIRFLRIWGMTILPSAVTMSLYFIVFGGLVGNRIGTMHGFDYAKFITPGLVMMTVITNSYMNVTSSFFLSKFQRSIEEILTSPTPNSIILLGYCMGGVLRGIVVGFVVILVSLFFTHLTIHNIGVMVFVVVLSAMMFSLAGFINAIFANKFDDIAFVPTFVLAPLTYLGGVFYSIEMLPKMWQNISMLNPILYLVNVFRYGMLGISDVNVVTSLVVLVGMNVLLFVIAMILLDRVKHAAQICQRR